MWADALGLEEVTVSDNFFELGGQSLASMRVVAWLRDNVGVAVDLRDLRQAPTVKAFALRVEELRGKDE